MKRRQRGVGFAAGTLAAALLWGSVGLLPLSARADQATGLILKKGDRVAIVGDSITEQKLYSKFMEAYLVACVPQLDLSVVQFGWSGETAAGWVARMDNDLTPWKATVVTTCYGMNDGGYQPYNEAIGRNYQQNMSNIVSRLKLAGVTMVVGSPGAVDSTTFRPGADGSKSNAIAYNDNLAHLAEIDRALAAQYGFLFADLHTNMMAAMAKAKAAYGDAYHVCGLDGVHPWANGQLVMAYSFLKAMGLDGNIGTITVDWTGKATATDGHKIVSSAPAKVEIESSRYPFCFSGGEKDPAGTLSILPYVPFQDDLNRFVLVVQNFPDPQAEVTWGKEKKAFSREQLAKGINLAAEFLNNPFKESFDRVVEAVGLKQQYETLIIKNIITNFRYIADDRKEDPEFGTALDLIRQRLMKKHGTYAEKVHAAMVPVKHVIEIAPAGKKEGA